MITEIEKKLHDYWEHRAPTYYVPDVFGRRIVAAYLIKLHPQSLIEVGCGNGELFSGYKDIPDVVAVDWSDNMLTLAKDRVKRHDYKNIRLEKLDITQPLAFERAFEVALTRTVLMHIHPTFIEVACRNLTMLSKNVVVMEWYKPGSEPELAWHNFHHEYVQLFRPLGYELIDSYDRPDGLNQILFHFRRQKGVKIEREDDPEKQQIKVTVTEVGKPGAPQGS